MEKKRSCFNMPKKEYVILNILRFVLSFLSLTIATPFLIYWEYKKEADSTIIDGKQLKFVGKLKEIILVYYIWLLITGVIVTIYLFILDYIYGLILYKLPPFIFSLLSSSLVTLMNSAFLKSRVRKWKYSSTIIKNAESNSSYKGNMLLVVIYSALRKVLAFISVGLFYPLMKQLNFRYECQGVIISSYSLKADKEDWILLKKWMTAMGLTLITFGIYWPFFSYELKRLMVERLHLNKKVDGD